MKKTQRQINQVKSKRPAKPAKASGKAKTAPAKVRRLGGASAANGRPPWNSPNWGQAWDKFLWGEFEQILATSKRTPKRQEELRKRYREKLTGWIKNMVDIRTSSDAKWASMPTPPEAQVQAAEAECEALIAAHLQELEAEQDLKQATGRRAFTALTLQDAGYSLAAEIAGGDGQLEISLEALALWLQEGVESKGEVIPRWRTMPADSFHHLQRKPHKRLHKGKTRTLVQNASEVRLKTTSEEWLWRELARSAFEDAETAKALHHLLGWHQGATLSFLQRFLAARHSSQDKTRERLITTAAAIASGNPDRIAATSKEDRHRIARDYPPDTE
jgi:hypothetical protein